MPKKLLYVAAVAGLLAIALALSWGCGGGADENTAELEQLLSRMALTPDDFPLGLQQASATYSTNEDVADGFADAEAALQRLESLGRRLGHDVQLVPGPEAPAGMVIRGIEVTVSIYETPEGASQSFEDGANDARATDWERLYSNLTELDVQERPTDELGDQAIWFRVSGIDDHDRLSVDDQVARRVGPVRGFLRVATLFGQGVDRDIFIPQVSGWTQTLAERIQTSLADDAVTAGTAS